MGPMLAGGPDVHVEIRKPRRRITPSGKFFLIPRCRLGHSRTSMGWKVALNVRLKVFAGVPPHTITRSARRTPVNVTPVRTPRWSPSIWSGSGTFECKVKVGEVGRASTMLARAARRAGDEVSIWVAIRVPSSPSLRQSRARRGPCRKRPPAARRPDDAQVGPGGGVADDGEYAEVLDERIRPGRGARGRSAVASVGFAEYWRSACRCTGSGSIFCPVARALRPARSLRRPCPSPRRR